MSNGQPAAAGDTPKPKIHLTDEDVTTMRNLHELNGWSYSRVAAHYGVSYWTAKQILCYRRRRQEKWKR